MQAQHYLIDKNIRENTKRRQSFNELATKTFGLSFENWYQNGYWTEDYRPYALLEGDKVIANVSVNIIDLEWEHQTRKYIQLGTVMTDEAYRNQGLSRILMEEVMKDWADCCDSMYLFAGEDVLDFYPKFGFVKADEHQQRLAIQKKETLIQALDMSVKEDIQKLMTYYAYGNPYAALSMQNNTGLLMFYCSQFLRDCVYYVKDYDAILVAEMYEEKLICYDVYAPEAGAIEELLGAFASEKIKEALLGFTAKEVFKLQGDLLQEEDTTLFILKGKENLFAKHPLMFPMLSHA